eukprot:3365043-Prymnesium_polylepis.4
MQATVNKPTPDRSSKGCECHGPEFESRVERYPWIEARGGEGSAAGRDIRGATALELGGEVVADAARLEDEEEGRAGEDLRERRQDRAQCERGCRSVNDRVSGSRAQRVIGAGTRRRVWPYLVSTH